MVNWRVPKQQPREKLDNLGVGELFELFVAKKEDIEGLDVTKTRWYIKYRGLGPYKAVEIGRLLGLDNVEFKIWMLAAARAKGWPL